MYITRELACVFLDWIQTTKMYGWFMALSLSGQWLNFSKVIVVMANDIFLSISDIMLVAQLSERVKGYFHILWFQLIFSYCSSDHSTAIASWKHNFIFIVENYSNITWLLSKSIKTFSAHICPSEGNNLFLPENLLWTKKCNFLKK